jgi:S1-C subfamily serine protease
VRPNGIAARIFQPGDGIMEVAGRRIASVNDLEAMLGTRQRVWQLTFKRGDKVLELAVRG